MRHQAFGLQVPEDRSIPCPRERVLMAWLLPYPPDFSTLVPYSGNVPSFPL